MQWGYKGPEPEPVEDGLMEQAIAYLTEKGWYFDHERLPRGVGRKEDLVEAA